MLISVLYAITFVICMCLGVYHLFFLQVPDTGLHFLLFGLYFFIFLFEYRGDPFSDRVYLLMIGLLLFNGIYHIVVPKMISLSYSILSFFFAISSWMTYQRVKQNTE